MYNQCRQSFRSCGSWVGLSTDAVAPDEIGQVQNISFYIMNDVYECPLLPPGGQIMRCSWATKYDVIYRYSGYTYFDNCDMAFCGMN